MEIPQNQNEFSFEQLVSMANFELEEQPPKQDNIDLSLKQEEDEEDKTNDVKVETTEEELEAEKQAKPLEEKPKETPDKKENKEQSYNFYSDLVKERLESGEWEDVVVEIDGEEKKLSELSDLDKDTFKDIEKTILDEKQAIFDTKYVDVDGLSETQVKLINIIKNGDLDKAKELFEKPEALQEPFQGYDPENDAHNEQVLSWYYQNRGDSPDEAKLLIEQAKKDLTIDKKAEKIVEFQKKAFKDKLEQTNKALLDAKLAEEAEIKEYRKSLSASLKEEGLGETAIRKFVDSATKKDKAGSFEIDTIYESLMKDPKQAKDLIYFMLDKENFVKKLTAETKKNVHVDNLRKIKIVSDGTKNKQQKEEDVKVTSSSIFDNLTFN